MLASGADTLSLTKSGNEYAASPTAAEVVGKTWDVSFGGGEVPATAWAGSLRVPPPAVVTAPTTNDVAFVLPASGTVPIRFTPFGGDVVYVLFSEGTARVACHLSDDGEFDVPVAMLPPSGNFVLVGSNRVHHELLGRTVMVSGTTRISARYSSP